MVSAAADVITIRAGKISDRAAMATIAERAYAQYVAVLGKKPAPMVADFDHHLTYDTVFIAQDRGAVVGFAIITRQADGFWLDNIAAGAPGLGLGTRLLRHVEAHVEAHVQTHVQTHVAPLTAQLQLYTHVKMIDNIGWYKRLGYVEVERRRQDGFERVYFNKLKRA